MEVFPYLPIGTSHYNAPMGGRNLPKRAWFGVKGPTTSNSTIPVILMQRARNLPGEPQSQMGTGALTSEGLGWNGIIIIITPVKRPCAPGNKPPHIC